MKKILALVLAFAMVVTLSAAFVSAEDEDNAVAIKSIKFAAETDGVVTAHPRGSSTSIDVLIDGDTNHSATAHDQAGIVLFCNTHCSTAEEYPEFYLIFELEEEATVNGGSITFFNNGMSMIGTPKDQKITVEYSDNGTDFVLAEDITLDCIDSNKDFEDNKGAVLIEDVDFSLATPVNAKYIRLTFTYGDSPKAFVDSYSKYVWEWMGMTEVSLDAVKVSASIVDDSSAPADESSSEETSAPAVTTTLVNVTAGKTYTMDELFRAGGQEVNWGWSDTAPVRYPDEDGKTLTDGVRSDGVTNYNDPAWIGFNATTPSTKELGYAWMNVDLGASEDLNKFVLYIGGKGLGGGISLPDKVEFFVSDNGENWTSVGEATIPADDGTLVEGAAVLELEKAVSAKYVRAQVSREAGGWMFVSEFEAYAVKTSTEKPTTPAGDSGILALAVIASLAVAGAVIVKKSR